MRYTKDVKNGNASDKFARFSSFLGRFKFIMVGILPLFLASFSSQASYAKIPDNLFNHYSENNVLYYDPCDGGGSSSSSGGGGGGNYDSLAGPKCAKLGELRTAMWEAASDEDKADFVAVANEEDAGISAIEGYMNQIISKHGNNGTLHDWLYDQCEEYRPAEKTCTNKGHKIKEEEQALINKALSGSNNIRFAIGNATGGSGVGAGKIVCVWNSAKKKCRDDVDYTKQGGNGDCKVYSPSEAFGECWGDEGESKWVESMESQCAGDASVGATTEAKAKKKKKKSSDKDTSESSSEQSVDPNTSTVTWDKKGWITGGLEGYAKEAAAAFTDAQHKKYASGKPNKIVLHYTQGTGIGLNIYKHGSCSERCAPHFTIDLLKKETRQHFPISIPSGAMKDKADPLDGIQIEIVGFGFKKNNPNNPDKRSKCSIDGVDYTSNKYCFAKFGDEEWDYLAKLLIAISKWGSDNGANIPLTSSVTWTGNVSRVRLSESEWNKTSGIVAHMHAPYNDHDDTGNIWPLVSAALGTKKCTLDGNKESIMGAKNAEKQSNAVGALTWSDKNKSQMKKVLENYGDLAYRTGQAYKIPWVAILVQGRYEDSKAECGTNNFWGIKCYPGSKDGEGANLSNIGEGFTTYGKTIHNGLYNNAIGMTDPKEYLATIGPIWVQGNKSGHGYGSLDDMKRSIDALEEYINSSEGQEVVAAFGAANCNGGSSGGGSSDDFCGGSEGDDDGENSFGTGNSSDIVANVAYLIDLANKQGANYVYGGTGRHVSNFKEFVNNGAPMSNIDCTGFASLVYWYTYGDDFKEGDIFYSDGIIGGEFSSYREVDRSEARPGDIFAYSGHGGIVIEIENGKVTKIAETGGTSGKSGKNSTLGYSGPNDKAVRIMNTDAGHFFRWKGAN